MNSKSMVIAGVLVAILAVVALALVSNADKETTPAPREELVLPGLRGAINDVERVSIRMGANSVELAREGDAWGAVNKGGYPIKVEDLRKLMLDLSDLKIRERKTANPDAFATIDVDDGGANARVVEFFGANDKKVAGVVLGRINYDQTGGGTQFVRRTGENQSWLAASFVQVNTTENQWMDTALIDIENRRVREVVYTHPDGEEVVIAKGSDSDANWTLVNLPSGLEPKSPTTPNGAAGIHRVSRFDNVVRRDAMELPEGEGVHVVLETFDGLVVESQTYMIDGLGWTTLQSRTADREDVTDVVVAEAASLNAKHDGWVFQVPNYISDRLTRRMEFFTQPIEIIPTIDDLDEMDFMPEDMDGMTFELPEGMAPQIDLNSFQFHSETAPLPNFQQVVIDDEAMQIIELGGEDDEEMAPVTE